MWNSSELRRHKSLSRTRFHSSGNISPPSGQPLTTFPRTEASPTLICTAHFEIMFDIQLPTMAGTFFSARAAVIFEKVVSSNAPSMSMKTRRLDYLSSKDLSIRLATAWRAVSVDLPRVYACWIGCKGLSFSTISLMYRSHSFSIVLSRNEDKLIGL